MIYCTYLTFNTVAIGIHYYGTKSMKQFTYFILYTTDRIIVRIEQRIAPRLLIKIRSNKLYFVRWIVRNAAFKYDPDRKWYGQKHEDSLLSIYLTEANGSYIDVGSGQPVIGNNTYFLYRRGWRGVLIDPITSNRILSRIFRPGDQFKQILVFPEAGVKRFYEMYPYEFSSVYPEMIRDAEKKDAVLIRAHDLPSINLNSLTYKVMPLDPFVMSIDIEGADFKVLSSLDFTNFSPRVICVEHSASPVDVQENDLVEFLYSKKYKAVGRTSLSSVLVHESFLETFNDYSNKLENPST